MGLTPRVARAALHHGEEPCISGTRGSGTIFFSGCSLSCVYCQNHEISRDRRGWDISVPELGGLFTRLRAQGAHNINLVSATHFWPAVVHALEANPPGIPVVYNTSGYESLEALSALTGLVDVYLPDLKYIDEEGARLLSGAGDYPRVACQALLRMCEQAGPSRYDEDGLLVRGVLVRHLVLPGRTLESIRVLNWIAEHLPEGTPVSLMGQYTPSGPASGMPGLDKPLHRGAYERVRAHMDSLGLPGYTQRRGSSGAESIPAWDGSGVLDP